MTAVLAALERVVAQLEADAVAPATRGVQLSQLGADLVVAVELAQLWVCSVHTVGAVTLMAERMRPIAMSVNSRSRDFR